MRQCELKNRYDPNLGRYVKKHVYDEGLMDVFKSVGKNIFGKTCKEIAKKALTKGATTAVTKTAEKTGQFVGNKAGDKIVQMLSKKNNGQPIVDHNVQAMISKPSPDQTLTDMEIAERVNRIISGGKLRKRKIM